jgi:hypothetical protein
MTNDQCTITTTTTTTTTTIRPLYDHNVSNIFLICHLSICDTSRSQTPLDLKHRYMTTNLANPHYMPETAVKVTLINFMITEEGLREQILGKTVLLEKPELERMKNKLIVDSASNTKKLKELENKILHVLSSSSGSILDDETAVNVLTSSKKLSNEIQQKQIAAKETEIEIDNARQVYVPVSRCATAMFMTITQLEKVDPMYQYSLEWYMVLFETSVLNSRTQQQKVNMTVLLGAQQESTEICSRLVVLVLLFSCCCFRVVALVLLHSFLVLFSCTLFLYSHSFCIILALFYSCTLLLVHSFTRALFYSCILSLALSLSLLHSLFSRPTITPRKIPTLTPTTWSPPPWSMTSVDACPKPNGPFTAFCC